MASRKSEIEKFTGMNNFGLWRIKMKAVLAQQGLLDLLTATDSELESSSRAERDVRAHGQIILSLGDKVLREVAKETTTSGLWSKLEQLHLTNSFANRMYKKQRLYSFKVSEDRNLLDQLDEYNKILDHLENIGISLEKRG